MSSGGCTRLPHAKSTAHATLDHPHFSASVSAETDPIRAVITTCCRNDTPKNDDGRPAGAPVDQCSWTRLLREHEDNLAAVVLRPFAAVLVVVAWLLFAVAGGHHALGVDPLADEVVADTIGAGLARGQVLRLAALRLGVALDHDRGLRVVLGDLGNLVEPRLVATEDRRLVALEERREDDHDTAGILHRVGASDRCRLGEQRLRALG